MTILLCYSDHLVTCKWTNKEDKQLKRKWLKQRNTKQERATIDMHLHACICVHMWVQVHALLYIFLCVNMLVVGTVTLCALYAICFMILICCLLNTPSWREHEIQDVVNCMRGLPFRGPRGQYQYTYTIPGRNYLCWYFTKQAVCTIKATLLGF